MLVSNVSNVCQLCNWLKMVLKKERKKERKEDGWVWFYLPLLGRGWQQLHQPSSEVQIRVTVNTSANQDSMKVDDPNPFTETQIQWGSVQTEAESVQYGESRQVFNRSISYRFSVRVFRINWENLHPSRLLTVLVMSFPSLVIGWSSLFTADWFSLTFMGGASKCAVQSTSSLNRRKLDQRPTSWQLDQTRRGCWSGPYLTGVAVVAKTL